MNCYADTSAFVTVLLGERGADTARATLDAADAIYTSRLTWVEAHAAIAAGRRARRLTAPTAAAAKRMFAGLFAQAYVIEVTERVAREAATMAEAYGLRGYDAVHLASSAIVGMEETVVLSWDRAQIRAARVAGFATAGVQP